MLTNLADPAPSAADKARAHSPLLAAPPKSRNPRSCQNSLELVVCKRQNRKPKRGRGRGVELTWSQVLTIRREREAPVLLGLLMSRLFLLLLVLVFLLLFLLLLLHRLHLAHQVERVGVVVQEIPVRHRAAEGVLQHAGLFYDGGKVKAEFKILNTNTSLSNTKTAK